jgi:hypothetical protein
VRAVAGLASSGECPPSAKWCENGLILCSAARKRSIVANQLAGKVDYPIILRGYKVLSVSRSKPYGAIVDVRGKGLEKDA